MNVKTANILAVVTVLGCGIALIIVPWVHVSDVAATDATIVTFGGMILGLLRNGNTIRQTNVKLDIASAKVDAMAKETATISQKVNGHLTEAIRAALEIPTDVQEQLSAIHARVNDVADHLQEDRDHDAHRDTGGIDPPATSH